MSDLYLDIEIKRSEPTKDKKWTISGYATTVDLGSEGFIITREAISRSVDDLIRRPTMLLNHDQNRPIGRVTKAEARDQGLYVEAFISRSEPEIWAKIQEGVLNKFSVRGKVLNSYEEFDNDVHQKVLYITRMELQEVSVVAVPAVPQAQILEWVERKAKFEEVNDVTEEKKETQEIEEEAKEEVEEEVKASAKAEKKDDMSAFIKSFEDFKTSMETQVKGLSERLSDFEEAIASAVIEDFPESDTPEIEASAGGDNDVDEIIAALNADERALVGDAIAITEEISATASKDQQQKVIQLKEILASLMKVKDEEEYPSPESEGLPPAQKVAASAQPQAVIPSPDVTEFSRAMDETVSKLSMKLDGLFKNVEDLTKKVEQIPIHRGIGPVEKSDPVSEFLGSEDFKQKTPYDKVVAFVDKVQGGK